MGIHFVNIGLVDGELDVNNPEALIYEPRDGAMRLVGVECTAAGPVSSCCAGFR